MFKLSIINDRYAPLAQLDRASGYGPEGQGFESLKACQKGPSHRDGPFWHIIREKRVFEPLTLKRGAFFERSGSSCEASRAAAGFAGVRIPYGVPKSGIPNRVSRFLHIGERFEPLT